MAQNWTRCIYAVNDANDTNYPPNYHPDASPPPPPLNNFLRRILKFRTIIPSHLEFCTTEIVEFLANCLQRRSTVKLPLFVICSVRSFGPLRLLSPLSLSSTSRLWLDWKKGWREGPFENCSRLTLSRSLSVSLSLCRSRIQPRHGSLTKSKWSKTSPVVSGGGPSLGSEKGRFSAHSAI